MKPVFHKAEFCGRIGIFKYLSLPENSQAKKFPPARKISPIVESLRAYLKHLFVQVFRGFDPQSDVWHSREKELLNSLSSLRVSQGTPVSSCRQEMLTVVVYGQ